MSEQRDIVPAVSADQTEFNRRFGEFQHRVVFDDRLQPYITYKDGAYHVNDLELALIDGETEDGRELAEDLAAWSERDHNELLQVAGEIIATAASTPDVDNANRLYQLADLARKQADALRELRLSLQEDIPTLDEPRLTEISTALAVPTLRVDDASGSPTDTPPRPEPVTGGLILPETHHPADEPGAPDDTPTDEPQDEPDFLGDLPEDGDTDTDHAEDEAEPHDEPEADTSGEPTMFEKMFPRFNALLRHGKPLGKTGLYNQKTPWSISRKTPDQLEAERRAAEEKKNDQHH